MRGVGWFGLARGWGSRGRDGVAAEGRESGALAFRLSLSLTFSTSEQTASLSRTWFSQL